METTFGERLALARRRAGIDSQAALGDLVGAGRNAVQAWEADTSLPQGDSMVQLPGVLQVSGHWLLTGDGPIGPPDGMESLRLRVIGAVVDGAIDEATLRLIAARPNLGVMREILKDDPNGQPNSRHQRQ